jgi:hypothetical protein
VSELQPPPTAHDGRLLTVPRNSRPGTRRWQSRAVQLCWRGIVRLPGSQPLLLRRIERSLEAEDFRLDSGFAIFTRSARGQEMPPVEQIPAWPRSLRAVRVPAGLAAAGGAVLLSWLIAIQRANPADGRPDVRG